MKKLKFKGVDGGPTCKIGENQIDAFGIHERTLLIVECVVRTRGADQPLRAKIKAVRGIMADAQKAVETERKFKDIEQIRFIIATTDKVIKREDLDYANGSPQVYIWDGNIIEYYRILQRKIGQYAKYSMLAELGIRPTARTELNIPAMRVSIYNRVLYSFFAYPRDLLKFSYVARREEARESYYQRLVERRRIISIAKDYLNKRGVFPNSILLSFNEPPAFSPVWKSSGMKKLISTPTSEDLIRNLSVDGIQFGVLTFPERYESCWIIDGQHRLFSFAFARASVDQKLSVIAFEKLPLEDQARYFLDINSSQKQVPADLLWDLRGELMPNSPEGVISRVVKTLNLKGPLRDLIHVPSAGVKKPGRKLLKFSGMCTNMKRRKLCETQTEHMLLRSDRNPIHHKNPDAQVQRLATALNDYFQIVDEMFSDDEKRDFWLQNSGVAILVALYELMVGRVRAIPGQQEMSLYLGALVETFREEHDNVKELRLRCSSEGGRSEVTKDYVSRIASILGDREFSIPGWRTEFEKRISQFEREFATFLVRRLAGAPIVSGNWIGERFPPRVIDRLVHSYGKIPDDVANYLTLGECNEIVRFKNNLGLIRNAFVHGERGFPSEDGFGNAMDYVTEHRNSLTHKRPLRPGYADESLRDVYFNKLSRCLAEARKEASSAKTGDALNSHELSHG